MLKKTLLSLLFILLCNGVYSQNENFARQHLEKLCSRKFYGRGYSLNGGNKAANYIVGVLKKYNNIDTFNCGWFQNFPITVNVFENKATVKIDNHKTEPGKHFLVQPWSKSIKGKFNYTLSNDSSEAICTYKKNNSKAPLKISTINQMTYQGISQHQKNYTELKIVKENLHNQGTIKLNIDANLKHNYNTQNILCYIKGQVDTFIVVSAHYDHIGTLGKKTYFPGAHDNGSGAATLIDIVQHYSKQTNKPYYSLAFMFFSGEEVGLIGSSYYVEHPAFSLSKIKFLINLDMLGSGDDGITMVNSTECPQEFELFNRINNQNNYLSKIAPRKPAANSDHWPFYKAGVKAVFIYTMGQYKEYHNITDKAKNLPMPKYNEIFKLVTNFIEKYK